MQLYSFCIFSEMKSHYEPVGDQFEVTLKPMQIRTFELEVKMMNWNEIGNSLKTLQKQIIPWKLDNPYLW